MKPTTQFPIRHPGITSMADPEAGLHAAQALATSLMADASGRREIDGGGLDSPSGGQRGNERPAARDNAIRVDTERLD